MNQSLVKRFAEPLLVVIGILLFGILQLFHVSFFATIVILAAVILGSYRLIVDTITSLSQKQFALDYIAILAVALSVLTGEYFVAAIIALMISSGRNLEAYGVSSAKQSLTKLVDRIPSEVTMWRKNERVEEKNIGQVLVGEEILIRKGEIISLDGVLRSDTAITDESSLTGEPYIIERRKGDILRSGTINTGNPIVLRVTKAEKDSTYRKIIEMVKNAQDEKAPLVRLADKYSTIFTLITFVIAGFAYLHAHTLYAILAVLVIATPCPLILATPIALLGGVNKAAKRRIIVKKLASLEVLSRVHTFIFDKTGTITIGKPHLNRIEIHDSSYDEKEILAIADAIERNSIHPIAKAVIEKTKAEKIKTITATEIHEELGSGISGIIEKTRYTLKKYDGETMSGITIGVYGEKKLLALLHFSDEIKSDSKDIMNKFKKLGLELFIFTGDKKAEADRINILLGENVTVSAELTPAGKKDGVERLKKEGKTVAMIGDGINDAPALALADVGLVFSNEEQTAASEAADIVLLGGNFSLTYDTFLIAKNTIRIALQSIIWGIGLSIIGMLCAAWGLVPPLWGAGLQEAIDVAVILNALRTSR